MTTVEAVYGQGWRDAVVAPMSPAEARARDASGEPYVVLLTIKGRVDTLLRLSWRAGYAEVTRFDALGRRVSVHVFRAGGGPGLFLFESQTWRGPQDAGEHEFPHVAARHRTRYKLDGRRFDVDEPQGDRGGSKHTQSLEVAPRLARPAFGAWHELLAFAGAGEVEIVDAAGPVLPVAPAGSEPWRPPSPLRPDDIEALFVAGTRRHIPNYELSIEVHEAGSIRLPSGRLVAADPSSLDHDAEPFAVAVGPGTYPVTVSLARFVTEPEHSLVAAVKLSVTDKPVATWEMALRDGQDPLELGHDEFFGFGVDAGMGCFVDAESCPGLTEVWKELGGLVSPRFTMVADGAMAAWSSGYGDGSYPVWIGRDDAGEVVCFVADMLLFTPE